ncbi:bifunctional metallophosphatase/5'-nucleotidase [Sphingomicrobium astaxanthinifaciens]|uniref:bifunctional metallophosphatase/5'-nucleotidase n=1 Tax=Sphingomicrobium astaxanthinifaciens TaxID=1227949 RepID=UPI001FCC7718|nr:bifunctional UDP-sugar hydrolase/5'-nucleotidase [Sphingomicrobium astaxanthinifaciens]MCJ7420474.1 bifunctional metallophosphatase/5'-nucleotidase [Sphingomicrobium astaxanthinifaciens]
MRLVPVSLLALAVAACSSTPPVETAPVATEIQLLALNDLHGRLEAPEEVVPVTMADGSVIRVPAGGAAMLGGALKAYRTDNSMTVAAGDLIGATPLASALFLDEPTIEALDLMGLDYSALGNHEFDKGVPELLRIQNGGCEQFTARTPCALDGSFDGADFDYMGANVFLPDGTNLLPDAFVRDFGAVQVGIIGLPLVSVPGLVAPNLVDGLVFTDEAETANALVPSLLEAGADTIVLLIHQGARGVERWDDKGCEGLSGEILPIVERLDPAIAVVVSGHTHAAYTCRLPMADGAGERLLTSAGRYGAFFTDIRLAFAGEQLVATRADNVVVQGESFVGRDGEVVAASPRLPLFTPDPAVAALVERTLDKARPQMERVVGRLSGPAPDHPDDLESPAANLIADAQLAATRAADRGGAQLAFINGGGVRDALVPGPDGAVTFEQLFAVQPFGNTLMTVTLSGAELKALLEQQFVTADGRDRESHLIPSGNFTFAYDLSLPAGERVVSMRLDGVPIDPARDYRVTTNNFVANGGDGYSVFTRGRGRTGAGLDLDALVDWIAEGRAVPAVGRIDNRTPAR